MDVSEIIKSIAANKGISEQEVANSNLDKLFDNYSADEPNFVSSLGDLANYINSSLQDGYAIDIDETPGSPSLYDDPIWSFVLTRTIKKQNTIIGTLSLNESHVVNCEIFELYADALSPDEHDNEIPRACGKILDKVKYAYAAIKNYKIDT